MRMLAGWTTLCGCLLLAGCGGGDNEGAAGGSSAADSGAAAGTAAAAAPACDADNGGIQLPQGFCALVVASGFAPEGTSARHLVVASNGTVYVAVQGKEGAETAAERGGVVALRDTDGDGKADTTATFGPEGGTGMALEDGSLYFATNSAVLRYQLGDALLPTSGPDTVVQGLPSQGGHTAKSIALGPQDQLWVNVGSATNACQVEDRQQGSPGRDPCPELSTRAGVWLFSASKLHQRQSDGERWATGIRNAMGLDYDAADNALYATQHGRDQLNQNPGYTAEDNAERPAEELQRLTQGADFGWPYCWYDNQTKQRVPSPEFGDSARLAARCASAQKPAVAFPGHWAPNDLLFYSGQQFPERFRGGAFIAFHGSWNRAPLPQAGYKVVFVPFQGGQPAGNYETFADGFAGPDINNAQDRPVGLAQGPDGSLYIASSTGRKVWRVMYSGNR